jgi:methionyl-tRNA formyltransferase
VIKGEKETGVTIMQMDEGMDTGDILLTASIPIHDDDTAGSVFTKLADLGGKTLLDAIRLLKEGKLYPLRQDDSRVSLAPLLSKEMGHLDWTRDARSLHCLIRGLDPWPSAYGFFQLKRFRFYQPQVIAGNVTEKPGTLCRADKEGLLVATGKDYLLIQEIQPEGKKRMDVHSCLCGFPMPAGEQFT